jgi:hypothetical protein
LKYFEGERNQLMITWLLCRLRLGVVSGTTRGKETWDRCCDFLNIFAKKIGEKMAF